MLNRGGHWFGCIVLEVLFKRPFFMSVCNHFYTPAPRRGRGYTVLPLSVYLSFRPSKIFFVTFFSATIDGRNLIFGHKLHISAPYRGKRFWTRHTPTSCLPTWLVFIHIEHICEGITVHLVLSVIFGHFSLIPMRDFVSIKEQYTEENVLSIMSTVSQHT